MEKFFEIFETIWKNLWNFIYENVPFFKDVERP